MMCDITHIDQWSTMNIRVFEQKPKQKKNNECEKMLVFLLLYEQQCRWIWRLIASSMGITEYRDTVIASANPEYINPFVHGNNSMIELRSDRLWMKGDDIIAAVGVSACMHCFMTWIVWSYLPNALIAIYLSDDPSRWRTNVCTYFVSGSR